MKPTRTFTLGTVVTPWVLAAAWTLLPAMPVQGQSLADRINHVMQKRGKAQAETKGRMVGILLYSDLTIQFTDTPAREAFNYLQTTLGVNIVGRYSDDRTGTGIDPDLEISIDVVDKPALTVLEMILDQCSDDLDDCSWQLRRGYIEVGTKTRLGAKSAQEIRYYPVRDLLFEPPNFDNAPNLDLDTALNQGNQQGGGGGGGGSGGGGFGGGGGGSGGGGGGSGGGGGGSLFGDPADDPQRLTEIEQANQLIELIMETVEPEGWVDTGGEWGTIRYYQGTLIIRAPDFMHRQISGYPIPLRPGTSALPVREQRYVTFTGGLSEVHLSGIRQQRVTGSAGNP